MTTEPQAIDEESPLERRIRADIVSGERADRPVLRMLRRMRTWVSTHRRLDLAYRTTVGIVGGGLSLLGLLLVPLPGPGWLVVFLGLAILGTEFHWAKRVSRWLKRMLDRFWAWWKSRRERKARAKEDLEPAAER